MVHTFMTRALSRIGSTRARHRRLTNNVKLWAIISTASTNDSERNLVRPAINRLTTLRLEDNAAEGRRSSFSLRLARLGISHGLMRWLLSDQWQCYYGGGTIGPAWNMGQLFKGVWMEIPTRMSTYTHKIDYMATFHTCN